MGREHANKDGQQEQQLEHQPQPVPMDAAVEAVVADQQDAAWGGSPETAAAREAARRTAADVMVEPQDVAAIESQVSVPTPADEIRASGLPIGPELDAELEAESQAVKRDALGRGLEVVMAGSMAGAGAPGAEAVVASAPPEAREAAQQVAETDTGGAPLPADVRADMETTFGADFSEVRVHTADDAVADLGAGGATHGEHIHFAPGAFDPETPEGKALLGHELAHVVQQRDAGASGAPHVAGSDAPAEKQAEQVQDAIAGGGPMPEVAPGSAPADAVHLGEAGVHQGIELSAVGLDQKQVKKAVEDAGKPGSKQPLTAEQKKALEMYAGNFMRDFSQFQVPKALTILSQLPSGKGTPIGAAGARTLTDAVVQSIAIMELGKDIGKSLVVPKNVGVYEAETHLDNPIGTSAAGDFITDTTAPTVAKAPIGEAKCVETVDAGGNAVAVDAMQYAVSPDKATNATHAGSAVPGLQFENPELYKVSEGGLANHMYNSIEHCKDRMLDATRLGPSPQGRMNLGMGQHIIEDYFSHSNFIEVALNDYVNDALASRQAAVKSGKKPSESPQVAGFLDNFMSKDGKPKQEALAGQDPLVQGQFVFVDTLYDNAAKDAQGKATQMGVTTGTFGGGDTMVSLGHVLLPQLPKLEASWHRGVDATFGVIQQAAKQDKPPTWKQISTMLEGAGTDGAIAQVMLEATSSIGLAVPCPTGFDITYQKFGMPIIGNIDVPNGITIEHTDIPITDALVGAAGTYVSVMKAIEGMKEASGILKLDAVIKKATEAINQAMTMVMAAIKKVLTNLIRDMIVQLYNIDPKKAAHGDIATVTSLAEEQMHEMEEDTSMASRLSKGGDMWSLASGDDSALTAEQRQAELERRVGPVAPKDPSKPKKTWGTAANPFVSVNGLPPSHSEISKDHPPHNPGDHDEEGKKWMPEWHAETEEQKKAQESKEQAWDFTHGHKHNEEGEEHSHESLAHGSTFYSLHRRLAVEADKHLLSQVETIWGTGIIGDKTIDPSSMEVSEGAIGMEAALYADKAAEEARRNKFRHAQTDPRVAEQTSSPEVRQLLNLVDYFISHPSATTWWKQIVEGVVSEDAPGLYAEILARNKTRKRRDTPE